jgi:peptide/nickel transport system substrate-binding protein
MMNPANKSPKRGAFRLVTSIEALDPATVVFHLKEPYASFTINLIRPTTGIVPANAGVDFSRRPMGSGPFRFVSQAQDDEVIVERNAAYSGSPRRITQELHLFCIRFRGPPTRRTPSNSAKAPRIG